MSETNDGAPAAAAPFKPGWRTSEFYITGLTIVAVVAGALVGVLPGPASTYAAGIMAGSYAIARSLAKFFHRPPPPEP